MMGTLIQDLRFAVRMLGKNPVLTATVVITLSLGIGANTAVFSVINGTLLRPLAYPDAERLVQLRMKGFSTSMVSVPNFLDWREQCASFVDMGVYRRSSCNFSGRDRPERLKAVVASASLLPVLGFDVHKGRRFGPEACRSGENQVVLLSDGFWRRGFGADPNIVDQSILLNDAPFTVMGVLPRELEAAWGRFDVWVPFVLEGVQYGRGNHSYQAVARLKPEVSESKARTDLQTISARLAIAYPQCNRTDSGQARIAELVRFTDARVGGRGRALLLLLSAAVALVLLIACANVANLLLARSSARRGELAIRAALGAERGRLVRQVFTECCLLGMAGGVFGIMLASWGVDLLSIAFPNELSQSHEISSSGLPRTSYDVRIDHCVLLVTFLLSLLTSVLFGLAPALNSARLNLHEHLKGRAGPVHGGGVRARLGDGMVVGQIAMTLGLTVCAGLLAKSLYTLRSVDTGFVTERLVTMRLGMGSKKHDGHEERAALMDQLVRRVAATPGVVSAGASHALPLCSRGVGNNTTIEEYIPQDKVKLVTRKVVVTPGYFSAIGIPLVGGRGFSWEDTADRSQVTIVSKNMAESFWTGESAIGKRLKYGSRDFDSPWLTVVGVVGDVRQYGLEEEVPFITYRPYLQELWWTAREPMTIVARTRSDPQAAMQAVQRAIWDVDPEMPVYDARTMKDILYEKTLDQQASAGLMVVFAALALVLAGVGHYGLMSYVTSRRTREIGIRIAIGATSRDVLRGVLGRSLRLTALGVMAGLVLAAVLGQILKSLMYGVSPADPASYFGAAMVLAAVSLLAGYIPARRATKVDPMAALRCE